jgi:TfoX/Sxy family transcriptional regulator of competence genes
MSRSLEIMGEACTGLVMVVKRMFGGHGFFAPNGGMFAGIVTDGAIVVKLARGGARDELMALGGHPWTYDGKGEPITMQEWIVIPDSFYDDTDTLHGWLTRAHAIVAPKKQRASKDGTKAASTTRTKAKASKQAANTVTKATSSKAGTGKGKLAAKSAKSVTK